MKTGNIEDRWEMILISQSSYKSMFSLIVHILYVLYLQHKGSFLRFRVAGMHGQRLDRSRDWQLIYFYIVGCWFSQFK